MTNEKYDCYIIKLKDGRLLKFRYDGNLGIYYQILIQNSWSEKEIIYRESFEHFYVLECQRGIIYVFCQDICGDLILCTFQGAEWNSKILLHMKHNIIRPIYIRAFFLAEDIHLFYNILDEHIYSEVLVHQTAKDGIQWSIPQVIAKLDYYDRVLYSITQACNSSLVLLNTMFKEEHQLTSRVFHGSEGRWGKEEVIYKSILPYVDYTFCVEANRTHYLFITQEQQVNKVIYKYRDIGLQKNTILFKCESIDSCLLIVSNKVLWALWLCDNKLYGCFSKNNGQNFSIPRVYSYFDKRMPIKVFYQEYLDDKQCNSMPYLIYVVNVHGEEKIFLQKLLEDSLAADMGDVESLIDKVENEDCEIKELKDCLTKIYMTVDILRREKGELHTKLKSTEEKIIRLNEAVEYEKKRVARLQYQLYKEKEKVKLNINDNEKLKEKNNYLEQKCLSRDKEKILIEKRLSEQEKENEILKQQLEVIKLQNILNNKETLKKDIKDDSCNKSKFSLIKWLFDENNKI